VEFQLELAVEIEAEGVIFALTHMVPLSFQQEVFGNAGFCGKRRKRHAETTDPSGKSGLIRAYPDNP